mgnify:CR=1 FL=1
MKLRNHFQIVASVDNARGFKRGIDELKNADPKVGNAFL